MNRIGFCDEFFNKTFDLFAQVQSDPGHVLVDAAQEQMLQAKSPHRAVKILKFVVNELDSLEVKEHAISAQLKTLCTEEESHISTVWNLFNSGGSKGNVPPELLAKLRSISSDPKAKDLEESSFYRKYVDNIPQLFDAREEAKEGKRKDIDVETVDSYIRTDVGLLEDLKLAWEFHCNSQEKKDYKTIQECDMNIGDALDRLEGLQNRWSLICHPSLAIDAPAAEPVDTQEIFDSPENFKYVLRTLDENYLHPRAVLHVGK